MRPSMLQAGCKGRPSDDAKDLAGSAWFFGAQLDQPSGEAPAPCASELASGKEDADENGRGDRVCAAMRDWDERLRLPAQWLPCAAYLRPRGRIVACAQHE